MIVPNAVQGDSRVIKTAEALSASGADVTLIGVNRKNEVNTLQFPDFECYLVPNPARKMHDRGIYYQSKENKVMSVESYAKTAAENLTELYDVFSFDVLYTHDMIGLPLGAHFINMSMKQDSSKSRSSIFWIHDVHEYVEGSTHLPDAKRLECLSMEEDFIREPDFLLTVSPILAQIIESKYILDCPISVFNTPKLSSKTNIEIGDIRTQLSLSKEDFLMVYCGNVKPERGIELVIESMVVLKDVHLCLLCNENLPHVKVLINLAKDLKVSNRVHTHPYVPSEHVSQFILTADLGIRPSTSYPNADLALDTKIFEYIHADLPIVASNTPALKKFFSANSIGSTFEVGNADDLAIKISELLQRGGKVKYDDYLKKSLSWDNQIQPILDLIGRLKPQSNVAYHEFELLNRFKSLISLGLKRRAMHLLLENSSSLFAISMFLLLYKDQSFQNDPDLNLYLEKELLAIGFYSPALRLCSLSR